MPNDPTEIDQTPPADDSGETAEVKTAKMINQAVTSQLKRMLAKELSGAIEAANKPLHEKLAALSQPPPDEEKKSKKVDPEYAALQQQIAELKDSYSKADQARVAAENKQRDSSAMGELRAALAKQVRPDTVDMVTEYLFRAKNVITFDEQGNPLYRVRRSPSPGLPEEDIELPLADGVQAFLKSREAAPFLPAPSSAGAPPVSQARRPGQTGGPPMYDKPATTDEEKIRRSMEQASYLEGLQRNRQ